MWKRRHKCWSAQEFFSFGMEPAVGDTDTPESGCTPCGDTRVPNLYRNLIVHIGLLAKLVPRDFVFDGDRILVGGVHNCKYVRIERPQNGISRDCGPKHFHQDLPSSSEEDNCCGNERTFGKCQYQGGPQHQDDSPLQDRTK